MSEASRDRTRLVGLAIGLLFVLMAGRGGFLALSDAPSNAAVYPVAASLETRADIVDRHGELLATSVVSWSLWANPSLIWDGADAARQLAGVLPDLSEADLGARLSDPDRKFVWVKRGLTPRQREHVVALGLEGLDFREEARRAYPRGVLAGQVLGFTNVDGKGIAGIELAHDEALQGGGDPVRLTLDIGAQAALEAELATAAMDYDMKGGAAILMDTRSGEIRGMASWPPFDPNRASDTPADDPARTNRAISAVYELGSIFKPFTIAAALEVGAITPEDRFQVGQPLLIQGRRISDTHWFARDANVWKILSESSNIGTVQVNYALGTQRQQQFLERAGLTRRAPIDLPGSAAPLMPERFDEVTAATVSYGHGISVTPLAFLLAFSAFGNDGLMIAPVLVEAGADAGDIAAPAPVRLFSEETTHLVTQMMRDTVLQGTARRADVAGYRVAGKTGTAEKPIAGGYAKDRNVSSFAAVFPADSPQYALIVTLDEPKAIEDGTMTAAVNAAPVAGRIIERVAPLLEVDPRFEDLRPATAPPQALSQNRSEL
ncbi:putative penicillin-binding protein 2 [Hyphomonas neptunium ATCC 15444]|uniref:Putative penicillin-binding protein 2 n=2 Tax=Hyphomonas TaxID=85 RepID=Q0BXT6_HYPNA|nr:MULTISPECIES: penicillin-binding protein 2 [Hyphomonas]ABI76637.1 putative penicillin-binding protein 2 [Hyphomonas neptunium ATCC 15444]KCZ93602.1 putative penicillin-binding protein 2 [Hyphomonas hirschiana VP5]